MLSKKDKEKILQLRQEENLSYKEIHKKTKFSVTTIMNVCREEVEENQKEEAKKQVVSQDGEEEIDKDKNQINKKEEVHFDSAESKLRAIPKAIDALIETEQLKGDDRAEWEKRIEDIRRVLRIEVDDRIAEEREDATEKRDEQWREHIKENYDKKEIAVNLRSVLGERDTTIEDLTNEIDEVDNLNTNLNNKNIDLNNDNTALQETNADLNDHIENYLDDAGRRERSKLRLEKESFAREKTDFDSVCVRLEQERDDFDQSVLRIDNCLTERKLELDQRDKYQNQRNEEQDERDKKLSELQKLINDQADKWRIERKKITQEQDRIQKLIDDKAVKWQIKDSELKQKKYELEQEKDAIAAVKKDLMDFAGEIGRELSELSRVEQKIERNKHFLFLTEHPSNVSLIP